MSDWQAGDLALCIGMMDEDGALDGRLTSWCPVIGAIYNVTQVYFGEEWTWLELGEDPERDGTHGWNSHYFRKVTPPEADAFDREVIAAMSGQPEQVPA